MADGWDGVEYVAIVADVAAGDEIAHTGPEVALAAAAKTSSGDDVCCTCNQRAVWASEASGHAKYTICH